MPEHLTAAVESNPHQAAAGLALHLGCGDLLLGLHQLVLHLMGLDQRGLELLEALNGLRWLAAAAAAELQAEGSQIAGVTGLHDGLLALWSRVVAPGVSGAA